MNSTQDKQRTLLIVEDDLALQKQMRWAFDASETVVASDRESAIAQLRKHEPAVVTMDLGLPPAPDDVSEGFKLLREILTLAPDTKVIVLTGQHDRENAIKAVGLGAYDFFAKPFEPELLNLTIERAFRMHDLQRENARLAALEGSPLSGLLTRDPGMLKVCRTIEKLASASATVALLGESGTGKEILARGLHMRSARARERFVAINCAAIPDALLESELFGYEKGAFTGAVKQTLGKIETANGGTLFLDEIGDLPLALQAKLLRFLQERSIERIGGREEIPVDVASCVPPIATSRRRSRPGSSARTCTIGLPRSSSKSRPCASATATRPISRMPSHSASPRRTAGARPSSRTTPSRRSRRTAGRATCASWKTASSVR